MRNELVGGDLTKAKKNKRNTRVPHRFDSKFHVSVNGLPRLQ